MSNLEARSRLKYANSGHSSRDPRLKGALRPLSWGETHDRLKLEEALSEAFHKADTLAAPLEDVCGYIPPNRASCCPNLRRPTINSSSVSELTEPRRNYPPLAKRCQFCMTDSEGHLADLASMLATGPLVISFNRGTWCDYCGLELRSLPAPIQILSRQVAK